MCSALGVHGVLRRDQQKVAKEKFTINWLQHALQGLKDCEPEKTSWKWPISADSEGDKY